MKEKWHARTFCIPRTHGGIAISHLLVNAVRTQFDEGFAQTGSIQERASIARRCSSSNAFHPIGNLHFRAALWPHTSRQIRNAYILLSRKLFREQMALILGAAHNGAQMVLKDHA